MLELKAARLLLRRFCKLARSRGFVCLSLSKIAEALRCLRLGPTHHSRAMEPRPHFLQLFIRSRC